MFGKKKLTVEPYDKSTQRPVIRASICTGERVAGFKDAVTGRFEEIMLLRSGADLQTFLRQYGVEEADIKREW